MNERAAPDERQDAGGQAPAALWILPEAAQPMPRDDASDPAAVILTCANCGARMDERKCKLVCACGYFLSCSDYY